MSAGGLTKVIPAKQIEDFKQNKPGMIGSYLFEKLCFKTQ